MREGEVREGQAQVREGGRGRSEGGTGTGEGGRERSEGGRGEGGTGVAISEGRLHQLWTLPDRHQVISYIPHCGCGQCAKTSTTLSG